MDSCFYVFESRTNFYVHTHTIACSAEEINANKIKYEFRHEKSKELHTNPHDE